MLDVDLLFWFRRRELAVGTAIGGIVSPWLFGAAASSAAISWGRADDRWWACGVALGHRRRTKAIGIGGKAAEEILSKLAAIGGSFLVVSWQILGNFHN